MIPFPQNFPIVKRSEILSFLQQHNSFQSVVSSGVDPLTLKPEQSSGVGSIPGRSLPLERHDKGSLAKTLLAIVKITLLMVWYVNGMVNGRNGIIDEAQIEGA